MVVILSAAGEGKLSSVRESIVKEGKVSIWGELKAVIVRPVFVLTALGYAANTGMMIGISTFGSGMLLEFGYFKTEAASSIVFGAMISLAGMIGTPLGGYIMDRAHVKGDESKLVSITRMNFTFATLGATMACVACFIWNKTLFLLCFTFGALLLFVCTAGINYAEMLSVPPENRSFAIALSTLCIHALGDVPSPIIVGGLLDTLAPACAKLMKDSADQDGDFVVNDDCKAELGNVRWTMFIACMYLSVTVVTFGLAYLTAWRMRKAHHEEHHRAHLYRIHQHSNPELVEHMEPLLASDGGNKN